VRTREFAGIVVRYLGSRDVLRDFVRCHVTRGEADSRKGDYDRAIADFDRTIQRDPKHAYAERGEAYEAKNDPKHAIADFDQGLKFDPSLADAQRGRERMQAQLTKEK